MQIINKTVRCSECGCIALPDAIKCPKCSNTYRKPEATCMSKIKTYNQPIPFHQNVPDVKIIVIVPSIAATLSQCNNS